MLDSAGHKHGHLRFDPPAALPVRDLVIGKSVDAAAEMLPRLFNLCRIAQQAAARLAFGLILPVNTHRELQREVLRDHLAKFYLKWPSMLGLASIPLPRDWQTGEEKVRVEVFGSPGAMPRSAEDFESFLNSGNGISSILRRIDQCFEPGEAITVALPHPSVQNVLHLQVLENSVAGRHLSHPVMQHIAVSRGYGPLWRATGRAFDLECSLRGRMPDFEIPTPGIAVVPATRGSYAIQSCVENGIVTAFERITPTDHLLADGSILEQTLNTLPAGKTGFAPLILEILDPCTPVRLREVQDA